MKWFWHLHTINSHHRLVRKYCFKIGLYRQGIFHDMSKYSLTEFSAGSKYYLGYKSPNFAERNDIGYSTAWMHHKGRNKHHFEYWTDYVSEGGGRMEGVKMPNRYVAEMICDRIAASRTYNKEKYTTAAPLEYFEKSKDRQLMHTDTEQLVRRLLVMIKEKGEEETLRYIKKELLGKKKRE